MADSQYGQLRESMPPPPRRRNQQDLSEDSRLGRAEGQEKESSALVSGGVSGVPTGFFDGADTPAAKKMKKSGSNEDFNSFMQEISAMGADKQREQDGTVCVVSDGGAGGRGGSGSGSGRRGEGRRAEGREEGREEGRANERGEDEDSVHADVSDEEDEEDFEQFVRRERMKEVKEAAQNRVRPQDRESHQEMMAQISAVASNNAVRLPEVAGRRHESVVESFNQHMQAASDSDGSESSQEDWRSKKLGYSVPR